MTARLLACLDCARHVRVNEASCPFCHVALPGDFGDGPVPVPPPAGLSRYEISRYALATAVVTVGVIAATAALASCGSTAAAYGCFPAEQERIRHRCR